MMNIYQELQDVLASSTGAPIVLEPQPDLRLVQAGRVLLAQHVHEVSHLFSLPTTIALFAKLYLCGQF